jgi:hypothetical protein
MKRIVKGHLLTFSDALCNGTMCSYGAIRVGGNPKIVILSPSLLTDTLNVDNRYLEIVDRGYPKIVLNVPSNN